MPNSSISSLLPASTAELSVATHGRRQVNPLVLIPLPAPVFALVAGVGLGGGFGYDGRTECRNVELGRQIRGHAPHSHYTMSALCWPKSTSVLKPRVNGRAVPFSPSPGPIRRADNLVVVRRPVSCRSKPGSYHPPNGTRLADPRPTVERMGFSASTPLLDLHLGIRPVLTQGLREQSASRSQKRRPSPPRARPCMAPA